MKLSKQISHKGVNQGTENPVGESSQVESRLSAKKVKLPLFEGEVMWLGSQAEIYFDVQNTTDEMRVKLARLSMEDSTITSVQPLEGDGG